jgi:hypothetical protein
MYNHLIFRDFLDGYGMEALGFIEFSCLVLLIAAAE